MIIEDIVKAISGRIPSRIERVVYEFDGELDECGDLQLWFGEDLVRLYVGKDVRTISVASTPWKDPFENRTEENAEYLAIHGRFRLLDVSNFPQYRKLIGERIQRVWPLSDKFGNHIGVRLETDAVSANVYLVEDELKVSWGDEIPFWR